MGHTGPFQYCTNHTLQLDHEALLIQRNKHLKECNFYVYIYTSRPHIENQLSLKIEKSTQISEQQFKDRAELAEER